jgi:hypothetical protein
MTLNNIGCWAFSLLCNRGHKYVGSSSLGQGSNKNRCAFIAVQKLVEQAIIAQIEVLDIHTTHKQVIDYYENTSPRDCPYLSELMDQIENVIISGGIQVRMFLVDTSARDRNCDEIRSMCEAVMRANDMEPRYEGPKKIDKFPLPSNRVTPRTTLPSNARYQTLAPFKAFNDNETAPRGVQDLTGDRGNIIYICPLCDIRQPQPLDNRQALLTHLRRQHQNSPHSIAPDVLRHFGIERCPSCLQHYSVTTIAKHCCRPIGTPSSITAPSPPMQSITPAIRTDAFIMTRPNQISDDLVGRLSELSYDEIFAHQAKTITKIHHSSVRMWSALLVLTLDGILDYGFGGASDSDTQLKADAFLKLFILAPRLVLSSSRGVANRAKLLLTGTVQNFNYLLQQSEPNPRNTYGPPSEDQRKKHMRKRVSELVQSCDLSRALNVLNESPRVEITEELIQKIRQLHPEAEPQHCIPQSASTRICVGPDVKLFDDHLLGRIIKDLRPHAAPDTTGLRPDHLRCLFRGLREIGSPEVRSRTSLSRLIHLTLEDPTRLGPRDFWENFAGGKLTVLPNDNKVRPVASKNCLYKIITSILGRVHDKALVKLAGPAHLAGKPSGVLAAALMAQMELDYAHFSDEEVRCILTTDAKAAFQSASRNHCHKVLCTEDTLREEFAPFFAHVHKTTQRVHWPAANLTLQPSSGFTQGDVNSSKLFTCNTASLVQGLQNAATEDATVVAIVDDITIMGTLDAIVAAEESRDSLQIPANYLINPMKQNIYTTIEEHVPLIKSKLPDHTVTYIGRNKGFCLSGIPLGSDLFIADKLQENLDKTLEVISKIGELESVQDKLILLLQCIPGRIQHLLAAVPPHLSRAYAQRHDEAIQNAVSKALDLGDLTPRDRLLMQRKISRHGLGIRSVAKNLEFHFLAGFMRCIKLIEREFPQFRKIIEYTVEGEAGYGRELADALITLQDLNSEHLTELLPRTIQQGMDSDFTWRHEEIQRELDLLTEKAHEGMFNLTRIPDQQDLATILSMDTSIFQLIPRSEAFQVPNDVLIYLGKQLFGKPQRRHIHKYCPNIARSTGSYCGVLLDSRDIHLRTCRMNNVNHAKHEAVKYWFQDLAKQAHIQTAPAPAISETSPRHPTKPVAGDLMLIDVSLRQSGRDGCCGVIDFSIITPAAESYCLDAATKPLHAAKLREDQKISKYLQAYKELDDIHFEPFVIESGGTLGTRAQDIFKKMCNLITQTTGQSKSSIAYFWKSRLLVTLAKITHENALQWATAHNRPADPDSATVQSIDCYECDTRLQRKLLHSSDMRAGEETG